MDHESAAQRPAADKACSGAKLCDPFESPQTGAEETFLAKIYRALGHPARLKIISALACNREVSCGEIVGKLPLAQSTVSQHLQVLKDAGLISVRAEGRCCYYGLNMKAFEEADRHSADLFKQISQHAPRSD